MTKLLSMFLYAIAAAVGAFGGWALFGTVAKPNLVAANTGTGSTGTGQTGTDITVPPVSIPNITVPSSTLAPGKNPGGGKPKPKPKPKPVVSSKAVFTIGGKVYTEKEHGDVTTGGYVNALNYSGPTGCSGRFFYIGQTGAFRYTAHNALMQIGATLYTFGEPPQAAGKTLVWDANFTGSKTVHVTVVVFCPLPSKSIPALPSNG